MGRQSDLAVRNPDQTRGSEAARVAQLEQNIRFLQEQHQLMLTGLHKEIDNLRHRNRGMHFRIKSQQTGWMNLEIFNLLFATFFFLVQLH